MELSPVMAGLAGLAVTEAAVPLQPQITAPTVEEAEVVEVVVVLGVLEEFFFWFMA